MTYSYRQFAACLTIVAVTAVLMFGAFSTLFTPRSTHANPLGFACAAYGPFGIASTSVKYLTPGTGTTTLVYDTYCQNGSNQTDVGNTSIANSLSLLTQLSASSTNTTLNISVEYSQDNLDWYQDNLIASSTGIGLGLQYPLTNPNTYTWAFASSTLNGVGQNNNGPTANSTRIGKVIKIFAPARYVRVVYSLGFAAGATNAAVWGEILPIKERP